MVVKVGRRETYRVDFDFLVTPVFPDFGSEPSSFGKCDTWSGGACPDMLCELGLIYELEDEAVNPHKDLVIRLCSIP